MVGANSADSLADGLRVDPDYWWGNNNYMFWLRTPSPSTPSEHFKGFVGITNPVRDMVDNGSVVNLNNALVPAFELNLSTVLFASLAPAASSDGAMRIIGSLMTFRYKDRNLGSAVISSDESKVDLAGVSAGTYLVAQNKDGAWAKRITNETSVSASEMGSGFTDFGNCKVWLEQTVAGEKKIYASMAKSSGNSTVSVMGNLGVTITSGNEEQEVSTGSAIADITVKAASGYYFSDAYVTELNQLLGGLQAEKVADDFTLKISGTPQSDVVIVLPEAVKLTDVEIIPGTGMQVRSGDLKQQLKEKQSMTAIVIGATDGYLFPDDYSIAGQNGITVTRDSDSQITVSGTPDADTVLTLPAATQKVYSMELSGEGTFGSKCVGYDPVTAAEFTVTNTGNVELTNVQVAVTGADSGSFKLTWDNSVTSIRLNDMVKITVKPNDGLSKKNYQAQLSVSADNCNPGSQTSVLQFEVTDHVYNENIVPPTCSQKGYTSHICQNCGDEYRDNETEMIPHEFGEWELIQSPGCVQKGSQKRTCKNCGLVETKDLDPDPNAHDWNDTYTVDKEPTCQSDGSQSIHCKNCDVTKDSQTIPRVDHKFTNYVSNNDATCTKDGTKTASCDYGCGITRTLPDDGSMSEHDYEWTYNNDAACEKNGTETGICRNCRYKTTREKAGTALEHKPSEWIIDQEATEAADGKRHKECTVCGKILETETIPAMGIPESEYKVLEGENQTYSGSGGLTVRANGDFSKFTGLKVDGNVVDASNYEARSGSTIITLKESYLSTLPAGDHILTFVYNDGEISTNFATTEGGTSEAPEKPDDPTGGNPDNGNKTDTDSGNQTGSDSGNKTGSDSGNQTGSDAGNKTNSDTNGSVTNNGRSPATGDKMNGGLYLLLLIMSGVMIAFGVERKKMKN